ncbi:DNA-binding protein [Segatella bryantii]|jgi:predicted histone-like DNA-binding protein|uniref:HU family DNA-binding protein n=1 Tax=Segatella bryantii TaxID=77095 RepID=UPI001EDA218D|nr:DNA-binding protein [Segatella bryantii]UKK75754.1 DNA-binding protein [Segatella bryantii]
MIKYILKQNKNKKSSAFGKYYAYPVVEETMDLAALAKHMEQHNSGFSEAMCLGVLKSMVKCIKEQILAGKNVKIDDLAIFSCGIKNREGSAKEEDFSAANNIANVKLRARATGDLRNSSLTLDATVRRASMVVSSLAAGGAQSGNTHAGGGSTAGGSTAGGNAGGSTGGSTGGSSSNDDGKEF